MRIPLLLAALALTVSTIDARAQIVSGPRRGFEAAITPWLGFTSFGKRYSLGTQDAAFSGSVSAGLSLDVPLTRRIGFLVGAEVSPRATQRTSTSDATQLERNLIVYRANAALGWRFKPAAPIFFYAGGGLVSSTKSAYPGYDVTVRDPEAVVGVGYDNRGAGRWGLRAVVANYFVFPTKLTADKWRLPTDAPAVTPKSMAHDWTFQLGAHYRLHGGGPAPR